MTDYAKMSKAQLIEEIRRLQSTATPPGAAEARLVHELQVLQIELEMQNQELRKSQQQLEESRDRYFDLYDFAPAGYLTLSESGRVLEINLTGALMLGRERANIIGKPFSVFFPPDDGTAFYQHLKQAFSSAGYSECELKIEIPAGEPHYVGLRSTSDADTTDKPHICRTIMTDITAYKQSANRVQDSLLQNRLLMGRIYARQEMERRHLARELHDELGQWLTAIQAEAEAIRNSAGIERDPQIHAGAKAIVKCTAEVHEVIHKMMRRLRPSLMDALGLVDSLYELVAQWRRHHPQVDCDLALVGDLGGLSEPINITVYRIIQESLTNVAKHADASQVLLRLHRAPVTEPAVDTLLLTVEDNGKGMVPETATHGLGFLGMRERVIAMGGEFMVSSAPGQGVHIDVRLPLGSRFQQAEEDDLDPTLP
jgi:PAS domain S-box-containing protein